jgi:DNA replication and repair protein RecF
VHVRWLELVGFRNYASLRFIPDAGLNILVGDNGHGKTSLLEALHVLLAGRSFRTPRLGECVAWDGAEARVAGEIADGGQSREVRLTLASREAGGELRGTLCPWARAVTFAASDVALLTGGPGGRRAYLDGVAAKLTPLHAEVARRYRLVLQQRIRLLPQLAGRSDADRLLGPWDEQLATLGGELVHRRLEALAAVAHEAAALGRRLWPQEATIELRYVPTVVPGDTAAATRERLIEALVEGRRRELQRGLTLVGPHRDDVLVRLGRADAHREASRGEQRLVALALRLAEAAAVRRRLQTGPVFLLDDLLSELDRGVRQRLLAWLGTQGQVLFSTTDAVPEAAAGGTAWDVRRAEVAAARGAGARGVA